MSPLLSYRNTNSEWFLNLRKSDAYIWDSNASTVTSKARGNRNIVRSEDELSSTARRYSESLIFFFFFSNNHEQNYAKVRHLLGTCEDFVVNFPCSFLILSCGRHLYDIEFI